jgi:hypothetical protein
MAGSVGWNEQIQADMGFFCYGFFNLIYGWIYASKLMRPFLEQSSTFMHLPCRLLLYALSQ